MTKNYRIANKATGKDYGIKIYNKIDIKLTC